MRNGCFVAVRKKFLLLAVLAVVAAEPVGRAAAGLVTIDDFANPGAPQDYDIVKANANPTILTTTSAGILGGQRQLMVSVNGTPDPFAAVGEVGGGAYLFGSLGPQATTANLLYSGPGNTGLGGADLTGGGTNLGLKFDFVFLAPGMNPTDGNAHTMHLQVIAYDATHTAVYDKNIPEHAGPFSFFAPFNQFVNSGVSFSKIDHLSISFNLPVEPNVNFQLSRIVASTAVPEPAGLALALTALLSLVALVRRRRSR